MQVETLSIHRSSLENMYFQFYLVVAPWNWSQPFKGLYGFHNSYWFKFVEPVFDHQAHLTIIHNPVDNHYGD